MPLEQGLLMNGGAGETSYANNSLLQVPKLLSEEAKRGDKDKGNIYVTSKSPPSYANQFKKDFKVFLRSRSK